MRPAPSPGISRSARSTNPGPLISRGEEHPPKPKKTLLFQNREQDPAEEQRISDRRFRTAFIPPLAFFGCSSQKMLVSGPSKSTAVSGKAPRARPYLPVGRTTSDSFMNIWRQPD